MKIKKTLAHVSGLIEMSPIEAYILMIEIAELRETEIIATTITMADQGGITRIMIDITIIVLTGQDITKMRIVIGASVKGMACAIIITNLGKMHGVVHQVVYEKMR